MNRTFLSLYIVLVLSVVSLGWMTDKIWQAYSPDNELNDSREDVVFLLANIAAKEKGALQLTSVQHYAKSLNLHARIYDIGDLAKSNIVERLKLGEIVTVSDAKDSVIYYKMIEGHSKVLCVEDDALPPQNMGVYRLLIIGFYILIAVVIYFWIWPLTRDLKRLQESARHVGIDGAFGEISANPGSAIYDVLQSFNAMSQRIRELLASQKEMTHAISHELRTPLARMKFSVAALETKLPENTLELSEINENIDEMERLITAFLHYATFEARSDGLEFQTGEFEPMVIALIERLGLDDMCDVHNHLLRRDQVHCEWYLMDHCMGNLLCNAARYAVSKIRVVIAEDEHSYSVSVEDDGPGISEEAKSRVFDAFYREAGVGARGFGLGLALVKRILDWHKGTVSVDNSELGGARFILNWEKPKDV